MLNKKQTGPNLFRATPGPENARICKIFKKKIVKTNIILFVLTSNLNPILLFFQSSLLHIASLFVQVIIQNPVRICCYLTNPLRNLGILL
jgi:hypothetical protein